MATLRDRLLKVHPALGLLASAMDLDCVPDLPKSSSDWLQKSTSEAIKLRNIGNDLFRLNQDRGALQYYNKSIAIAPADSEELALAFGNRSAVFFRSMNHDLCILDVNRALNGRFPERSKQKLLDRKAECLARIQKENEYKLSITPNDLEMELLAQAMGHPLQPVERKFLQINRMTGNESDPIIDNASLEDPIWNTNMDNPLLQNVSSKVRLECNSQYGRHWVANNDIRAGEVLMIDEFFTLVTSRETMYCHCAYCTVFCEALIPCATCSMQMYCSERCRMEAYDSYHRTECKILGLLPKNYLANDLTALLLSLRTFLVGTKQGREIAKLSNHPQVYDILEGKWNCVGVPLANDYLSVLNLLWRFGKNECTIRANAIFGLLTVVFSALRSIQFIDDEQTQRSKNSASLTDMELFAAALILHNISAVPYYHSTIDVFVRNVLEGSLSRIGSGLSSLSGLMNHSCDANTLWCGNKRRHLIYSTKPIKKGEQLFTTYSFNHLVKSLEGRKKFLKEEYDMVCRCKACVEDWPLHEVIMNMKNEYLISKKHVIKTIERMHKWLVMKMKTRSNAIVFEYNENDLCKAFEFAQTIRKYVKEPSPTIVLCESFIRKCMDQKGNLYVDVPNNFYMNRKSA